MPDRYELTKSDLRSFDKEASSLVLSMQAEGWRGRMASTGHAVMYSPDGKTMYTVSRDSSRARSGRNARAFFRRWMKSRESA